MITLHNIKINGKSLPSDIVTRASEILSARGSCFIINGIDRVPEVIEMRRKSVDFAKIIGFRLRYGDAIWLHDGAMRVVNRENWKETWRMMIPKEHHEIAFRIEPREETSFDIMMPRREDLPRWAGKSTNIW